MRFRFFKVGDAKDYIIAAILLVFALLISVLRHQGGIDTLRKISIATYSVIEEPLSNVRVYRKALRTNRALQRQNILLQDELSRLRAIEIENQELRELLGFKDQSVFNLHPTTIVGKELTGINNQLTIDSGIKDSIEVGMPVITANGLAGKVVLVSRSYAKVLPYSNNLFRVSARLQENQAYGIVRWAPEQPAELLMEFVPKTIRVDSGFVVETSGASNQLPSGIPIGSVLRTVPEPGKETQRIYLTPFVSLAEIAEAYVVRFYPDSTRTELTNQFNEIFE
ncbi:MAG: rod shape-determining protein MreC [Bacteroidota bacterium]